MKEKIFLGNNTAMRLKALASLLMGYNAFAIAGGYSGGPGLGGLRRFFKQVIPKPQPRILSVLRITSGGRHVWCDTDKGIIRKPTWAVSPEQIHECRMAGR